MGFRGRVFVAGVSNSFYAGLFPANSRHFVHSSYSLHWLSQALKKGNVYISEASPPSAAQSYRQQFQKDFSSFLRFRFQEVVRGGCMVLIFFGRSSTPEGDEEFHFLWTVLSQAIRNLVSQGLVGEEELDSFDLPFYNPSAQEVEEEHLTRVGKNLGLIMRAVAEPLVKYYFGEELMELFFEEYAQLLQFEINEGKKIMIHFVLVLKNSK
ncbi:hypothetical protein AMTRI_Chr10g232120 [Amborella trichopoda]